MWISTLDKKILKDVDTTSKDALQTVFSSSNNGLKITLLKIVTQVPYKVIWSGFGPTVFQTKMQSIVWPESIAEKSSTYYYEIGIL